MIYSLFTSSGTPPTIFHKGIQHVIIFIQLHIFIEPHLDVRLEAVYNLRYLAIIVYIVGPTLLNFIPF